MAKKTTEENMDDRQAEICDLREKLNAVGDSLSCAEDCETPEDFNANTAEALSGLQDVIKELKALGA